MTTTVTKVEAIVEANQVPAKQVTPADALKELSAVELAYVGGGTASVCFV